LATIGRGKNSRESVVLGNTVDKRKGGEGGDMLD